VSERRPIVPVSQPLLPRASAVVARAFHDTHYLTGALDALECAVRAPNAEGRALASVRGDDVLGVIVFGMFGGASGAGRLHFVAVESRAQREGVARALVNAAIKALDAAHARFVLAELPDDPRALDGSRDFLEALGFSEESRIDDFHRDGIALVFMRRELSRD
jgi:ribosomal protein S18 acetylase RimI-like enzyme